MIKSLGLAGALLLPAVAQAQHVVGGGDPLMMLVAEARYDAIRMLEHLDQTGVPAGIDSDVHTFLTRTVKYEGVDTPQLRAMAAELGKATLLWQMTDPYPGKCAAIELNPEDPPNVYLSFPTCREMLTVSTQSGAEAVRTLVHESVHRFGYKTTGTDEDLASRVGVVVYNLWQAQRLATPESWADVGADGAPLPRVGATGVWTGSGDPALGHSQVIIWGGCNERAIPGSQACATYPKGGARLVYAKSGSLGEPPVATWHSMDQSTAPPGRRYHTAIWTGDARLPEIANKMIVFGGCRGDSTACDQTFDAAHNSVAYDPGTDRWSAVAGAAAPSPRVMHTAVWTATDEMIVWGGLAGFQNPDPDRALNDGGILSFDAAHPDGVWQPLPASPNAPAPRFGHTSVWTGTEMLVFGGCAASGPNVNRCPQPLGDGGFYSPSTAKGGADGWRKIPPAPFLAPRSRASVIWTGRYLVVWGGENAGAVLSDGGVYDAVTGIWSALSGNLPPGELGRRDHHAFYEPLRGRMVVWGGATDSAWTQFPSSTLIYDLEAKSWSKAATPADPVGRVGDVAAWIEDSLFTWGGYNAQSGFLAQGGLFNP